VQADKLEEPREERVARGSDIAAQMPRRPGIRYVGLNPGSERLATG
jgi:hypothetical protein